jgi:hypothetical protein
MKRALVLGAGAHIEIGLITGMAEARVDARNIQLVIGTSAGARAAIQLINAAALDTSSATVGADLGVRCPGGKFKLGREILWLGVTALRAHAIT